MIRTSMTLASCFLVACSGGGGNPDGGSPNDGGSSGDGGVGACTATAMPTIVMASFEGYSVSVVGQDAYFVDPSVGAKTGVVRHVGLDGSGLSDLVTPPMGKVILGATAIGSDLFYFQDDDAQGGGAIHLYKTARATGGAGMQVGTATFPGFSVNVVGGGLFGLQADLSLGVFAQQSSDLFINDGGELSRVSTAAGTKTVIASSSGMGGILFPALLNTTVVYKAAGDGSLYSAPASASMPSGTRLGTATCGMGRTMWMGSTATGFACGEIFGIDKIDAMGVMKTHVINTLMDKNPTQYNPTAIDGTTYYAMPKDGQKSFPISKIDFATNAITPILCDVRSVQDVHLTPTDIVWVEARKDGTTESLSLRRLAR